MLPWGQLIPTAISLAEMAGKILSTNRKQKAKTERDHNFDPAALLKRIETLENNELKQAELIQQMAQQNLLLIKKAENGFRLSVVSICIAVLSFVLFLFFFFLKP